MRRSGEKKKTRHKDEGGEKTQLNWWKAARNLTRPPEMTTKDGGNVDEKLHFSLEGREGKRE